ncbi:MAG: hypothetical protein V4706_01850 [Pseudomonadota bacterium]
MASSPKKLLTQAEYARSRKDRGLPGGSREAVRKAVDAGRITGFGPDNMLDQVLADAEWERNTRARLSPQAGVPTATTDLLDGVPTLPPGPSAPAAAVPDTGYGSARARREMADAEKAEIETAKLRGAMVMREDVDRAGYEIARELRDAMESSVNSLGAELAPITTAEECVAILRRHNRSIQDLLVRLNREKVGAPLKAQQA